MSIMGLLQRGHLGAVAMATITRSCHLWIARRHFSGITQSPFCLLSRSLSCHSSGFQSSALGASPWPQYAFHNSLIYGLSKQAVAFPVRDQNVEVLSTPGHFYETLKEQIRDSKERVVISSLYIGTGALEQELLGTIADSLSNNPSLRVLLLFDALRSTRKVRPESGQSYTSSSEMIAHMLLKKFAKWKQNTTLQDDRVRVALYRTPDLTKRLEKILPPRLNEVVGVCHMKLYIFDNNVIMSGANLSSSYFTNRQDRYILLKDCQNLADYLCELVDVVGSFSYILDNEGNLKGNCMNIDPRINPVQFRKQMFRAIQDTLNCHASVYPKFGHAPDLVNVQDSGLWLHGQSANTWVFPTLQMGSLGICQDEKCFLWLLENLPRSSCVHFASAYFNLTKEFQAAILQASSDNLFKILTAAPQANGFYGSRGISGLIPKAYSMLEKAFYERTCQQKSKPNMPFTFDTNGLTGASNHRCGIELFEYQKPEWTFHAKGLWCYLPNDIHPSMTLIGSSNFGFRSRRRDLEAQLFLMTTDPSLRKKLQEETDQLFMYSQPVHRSLFLDPERSGGRVSLFAAQLVRSWL